MWPDATAEGAAASSRVQQEALQAGQVLCHVTRSPRRLCGISGGLLRSEGAGAPAARELGDAERHLRMDGQSARAAPGRPSPTADSACFPVQFCHFGFHLETKVSAGLSSRHSPRLWERSNGLPPNVKTLP